MLSLMMSMPVTRLNLSIPKLLERNLIQYYVWIKLLIIYDVGSISVVDLIDKQRNGNDTMMFSIKLFGIYENNINFPNNDSS